MVLPESLAWHRKTGVEERFCIAQDIMWFVIAGVNADRFNFLSCLRGYGSAKSSTYLYALLILP